MIALRSMWSVVLAVWCVGCGAAQLQISSKPPGADITVDGVPAGQTPSKYAFDFGKKSFYDVTVSKVGYISSSQTVASDSEVVRRGYVSLDLAPDHAHAITTTSEAANNWRRIGVDKQYTPAQAWQRMVDSVTTHYANLEQMDQTSGYLRSVATTRTFKNPAKGDFSVRTYFIGTIAQSDPLVYKVKIVSERSESPGVWLPYDRVYTGDKELIEELQDRLGTK